MLLLAHANIHLHRCYRFIVSMLLLNEEIGWEGGRLIARLEMGVLKHRLRMGTVYLRVQGQPGLHTETLWGAGERKKEKKKHRL